MKLLDRAMQVHGKVCMIETRGPKHSLVLSVYREYNGTTYEIRRGACARTQRIFKHFITYELGELEFIPKRAPRVYLPS